MVLIRWKFRRRLLPDIGDWLWLKFSMAALTVRSLTYNELMDRSYFLDMCLQPIIFIVERFAKYLGKVFVFCVVVLTAAVVMIAYWVGLPYWWERNPNVLIFLIVFGNWLLLNVVFHYCMAILRGPGYPPHGALLVEVASICKKCISPKPPRTHHCSICDRCVLAMDHHCPWLNRCVGYLNARHFYLYMVYTLAGVVFIIIAGLDIGYVVLWLDDTGGLVPNDDPDLIGHPVRLNKSGFFVPIKQIAEYDSDVGPREHDLPLPPISEANRIAANPWKKKAVVGMAVVCVSVVIGLGSLTIMHGRNISRGQTCIEAYINKGLSKKSKHYRNPYDFGRKKNWKLLLGLTQGRGFVRHVLFPSTHRPLGNGLSWHTVHSAYEDWP